ncbi:MAG: hypothetical protein AB7O26_16995 [Planctomycetaceae bacterium]
MAGYFEVKFIEEVEGDEKVAPSTPKTPGSASLRIRSVDQYKGNLRIDFTLTGITGGSVTPPYGYTFLDEDEVVNCDIVVSGNTGTGTLEVIAFDGEDTDTDSTTVQVP